MSYVRFFLLYLLFSSAVFGQQLPFIPITGPNAPKGAQYLFEDREGGMWLGGVEGGSEGLVYFDGSRFLSAVEGNFPRVLVSGMAEDSDGGIWLATNGGVFRLLHQRLTKVVDDAAEQGILGIGGDMFLVSIARTGKDPFRENAFVRISKDKSGWRAETVVTSARRSRFSLDRAGNVLYHCENYLCEWRAAAIRRWSPGHTLLAAKSAGQTNVGDEVFLRDTSGCVWMRAARNAAYRCPGQTQPIALPQSVASLANPQILEQLDGSIVLPSIGQLAIGRPGNFRILTAANGYPSTGYSLLTRDGSLWLSNANGLFVFPPNQIEFWTAQNGIGGNSWAVSPNGRETFAVAGDDVLSLESNRDRWRKLLAFPGAAYVTKGPDNTLLVASSNGGVIQMSRDGKFMRRSAPTEATMLGRTNDGKFWAAGGETYRILFGSNALILEPQMAGGLDLETDNGGGLWTCSNNGLNHKGKSGWHLISKRDGLMENSCRSLGVGGSGDIWYGYARLAAFSLIYQPLTPHPRIQNFVEDEELGTGQSNFFHIDRRDWIWRGTEQGLYIADEEQARRGQWPIHLDRSNGIPFADTNQRSISEDKDGSIWFGAGSSIVHITPPADLVHPKYAPSVFISGFTLNNAAMQKSSEVSEIRPGTDVFANIGSLQFDRRNSLRLRFRLLPEQTGWKPERNLAIGLGKPRWGEHRLEVQARLGPGPWSAVASKSFTVLRPVWLSMPVLIGLVLAAILALTACFSSFRKEQQRAATSLPSLIKWRLAVLSPEIQDLPGGKIDGRFEVGPLLARGGFAAVFSGKDLEQAGKSCALKIFHQGLLNKESIERGFRQEVAALTAIHHPNVVRIFSYGTVPTGAPYLAMEFVDGISLRDLLNNGTVAVDRVANFFNQLVSALGAIHAMGICHRDVKPENIIVRNLQPDQLVLIDFSIAIVKKADETLHGLSRAAGTFDYMAPEQALGYAQPASDIYSLTKLLIEMLTGKKVSMLLPEAALDLPVRIRELATSLNVRFSAESLAMLSGALEFDPSKRPNSVRDFAAPVLNDLALASKQ